MIILTRRQKEVLEFIIMFTKEFKYPPTVREIGRHFGMKSTNGVNDHLKVLIKKGYLVRHFGKSRALLVTQQARKVCTK